MAARFPVSDRVIIDLDFPTSMMPTPTIDVAALMARLSPDGKHGSFILRNFLRWIDNKKPVDRWGYDAMNRQDWPHWRDYNRRRLENALRTIAEFGEMMDGTDGKTTKDRFVDNLVSDAEFERQNAGVGKLHDEPRHSS